TGTLAAIPAFRSAAPAFRSKDFPRCEWLQLPDEILGAHGSALHPRRGGLIRIHGVARLEVTRAAHPDGLIITQIGPCKSTVRANERQQEDCRHGGKPQSFHHGGDSSAWAYTISTPTASPRE